MSLLLKRDAHQSICGCWVYTHIWPYSLYFNSNYSIAGLITHNSDKQLLSKDSLFLYSVILYCASKPSLFAVSKCITVRGVRAFLSTQVRTLSSAAPSISVKARNSSFLSPPLTTSLSTALSSHTIIQTASEPVDVPQPRENKRSIFFAAELWRWVLVCITRSQLVVLAAGCERHQRVSLTDWDFWITLTNLGLNTEYTS